MADAHYEVEENLPDGRNLKSTLRKLRDAWHDYQDLRAVLVEEKDNAASGNAVYAKQATLYGYTGGDAAAKQAAAAGSFAEIDSCYTTCNGAILQACNRHL